MTKQLDERYYLLDEPSRTVYHTTDEELAEDYSYLVFLGSSVNPNIRMAVSTWATQLPWDTGYTIKEL